MVGGKAASRLNAAIYLALQVAALKKVLTPRRRHHKTLRHSTGKHGAQLFKPCGCRVYQHTALAVQAGKATGIVLTQRNHQRPQKAGLWLVHFIGHKFLHFAKAGVQGGAGCGVEAFKLLDALKNLCGHGSAKSAHAVQTKGMVAAQRVFEIGHGFLKGVPCR